MRRLGRSLRATAYAAALAAVCFPAPTPAAPPDGRQLLRDLHRHYRALTAYRDHGEIETITYEDGGELSRRHRFTTTGRGGSGNQVRLDLEQGAEPGSELPAEPLFFPPPDAAYDEGTQPEAAAGEPDLLFDIELVEPPPDGAPGAVFEEAITVSRTSLMVRVFDRHGEPMRRLTPEDFQVEVGGSEVPVESADWIEPGKPWRSELGTEELEALEAVGVGPGPEGPLVVLFVHSARESFRTLGHLDFRNHLRSLLAALPKTARLAVVAYDVRLKLWQDFTHDRERVYETVQKAVYFTAEPEAPGPGDAGPGLLELWDFEAARRTGFAEDALAVLGETLGKLPGDKVIVYLGWGLGEAVVGSFKRAAGALVAAGIPLHALNITPMHLGAGGHTLAAGLARMAKVTGGTYGSTAHGPERAWKRVARNLAGYYLLLLDSRDLPAAGGRVVVTVPGDRWTEVRTPSVAFAAAP